MTHSTGSVDEDRAYRSGFRLADLDGILAPTAVSRIVARIVAGMEFDLLDVPSWEFLSRFYLQV